MPGRQDREEGLTEKDGRSAGGKARDNDMVRTGNDGIFQTDASGNRSAAIRLRADEPREGKELTNKANTRALVEVAVWDALGAAFAVGFGVGFVVMEGSQQEHRQEYCR